MSMVNGLYRKLVLTYGTARNAAKAIGLKEQAIYKWKSRGIPARYQQRVRKLIEEWK